ncbi:NAD-dependent epimerase/dehydratase family protein [Mannheimia varigena]|uniref:NAD-dependent epimerase/dehydratase family protein n=1 Tax=Mannheimia varigena TaxID=85404 RepID=UPI0015B6B793|nr:NAD-dependent epimerase/dehydratase family protein [Mannheimia varigena]QLD33746.1 NAD-dependent epimerase/dehydratase family protein [Mannheimia varigena]
MIKILITGRNSYVGNSVNNWLNKEPNIFDISVLDVKTDSWKEKDFSNFDVIFHVAGIAHFSKDQSKQELYYKVNRDLTLDIANKAKNEGVAHFIFMSSIIVYGDSSENTRVITKVTKPNPSDFYGDSKLQAELGLKTLLDNNFNISIIRPPMIYGKGNKGNYAKLSKLAKILPIFPDYQNERSMIHIDNFCEFVKQIIVHKKYGILFPQNEEYVSTSDLVKEIAANNNREIYLTKIFNAAIRLLFNIDIIKKLFGNLTYDKELSKYGFNYQIHNFKDSVKISEE